MKRIVWIVIAVIVVLLGVSLRLTGSSHPGEVSVAVPDFRPLEAALRTMATGEVHIATASPWRIVLGGAEKANAASNHWAAVRQSATWANGNSNLADQLIMALKNTGLLNNASNLSTTTTINGVSYKIRLQTGGSCGATCTGVSASAYRGAGAVTKNFTNRFKMWRASDNLDVLELMFNDVSTPNTSSGILLRYRLGVLNPSLSDNPNLIVESYITGASPSRRQTYSWGAAFWTSGANAANSNDRGRVVLEEMTLGLTGGAGTAPGICVRIAARTVSTNFGCGTGNYYYALAYGQKTGTNFETTAKSGAEVNSLATSGKFCPSFLGGIDLKFGTFNGSGFIADGQTSVPNGFPDPSTNGAYPGVTQLFSNVNAAPNGNGTYDDLTKATLDNLDTYIAFHPANGESPGF